MEFRFGYNRAACIYGEKYNLRIGMISNDVPISDADLRHLRDWINDYLGDD